MTSEEKPVHQSVCKSTFMYSIISVYQIVPELEERLFYVNILCILFLRLKLNLCLGW